MLHEQVGMYDVIWMRLGDADDYHSFDSLDEVADELTRIGIENIDRHCLYGVTAPGFEGHNYISLYWGLTLAMVARKRVVN
jgi:hypothetical protein